MPNQYQARDYGFFFLQRRNIKEREQAPSSKLVYILFKHKITRHIHWKVFKFVSFDMRMRCGHQCYAGEFYLQSTASYHGNVLA